MVNRRVIALTEQLTPYASRLLLLLIYSYLLKRLCTDENLLRTVADVLHFNVCLWNHVKQNQQTIEICSSCYLHALTDLKTLPRQSYFQQTTPKFRPRKYDWRFMRFVTDESHETSADFHEILKGKV